MANCSCRRWQLTGLPCSHAISIVYYNNDKPENYLHDCYKVNIYLATYRHTLNSTHDKDCYRRSDQGPMIPLPPFNKKRDRKTLLIRQEVSEDNIGFTNGKVNKRGVSMRCSICGVFGHNKRYHGGLYVKKIIQ